MEPQRKQYNVVAAFGDRERAERAVEALANEGIPRDDIALRSPGSPDGNRRAESYAEMQEEVDHSVAGPSIFATESQTKGAAAGAIAMTILGALIGLAIGLIWAFAVDSGLSEALRIIIPVVVFGVAGSTIGFIGGGAIGPRLEGAADEERAYDDARLASERAVLVAVHTDDERRLETAAGVLEQLNADRIDYVHPSGSPLPPQAEDPRPADPPERWWEGPPTG